MKEPSYFKLCTESTPTHLALLDEVVSIHNLLHSRVLNLLVELFEAEFQDLEILEQVGMLERSVLTNFDSLQGGGGGGGSSERYVGAVIG